jgi:starch synthase
VLVMSSITDTSSHASVRKVVHVCREYGSLAGAGGMKDVTEGLAKASAATGIETHVILPFYRSVSEMGNIRPEKDQGFDLPMNDALAMRSEHITVHRMQLAERLIVHLVKAGRYEYLFEGYGIERHGIYQYSEKEAIALGHPELKGQGYADFFAMNVLLVKSALKVLGDMESKPDVVHCHDGHAALLPLLAQASHEGFDAALAHVPCVLTVHNAGKGYHQEVGDLDFAAAVCGLHPDVVAGCLLDSKFDPLLAGGVFSHGMNTVSENYAYELQHTGQDALTGWLGHALVGQGVKLVGITNGVDPHEFDPRNNRRLGLAASYSPQEGLLDGKEKCKEATLDALARREVPETIGLHGTISYQKGVPLLSFVGRLVPQKGMDTLADTVEELFAQDESAQLVILGDGEPFIENRFKALARQFHGRICLALGYSSSLASQVYAAGDFFLIPSRFEPCGLTDFFAQLAGNVPIVHGVGGLVKTVDNRFGFSYLGGKRELLQAIRRALAVYREEGQATLRRIQMDAANNLYANFTWDQVLKKKYLPFYQDAIARTRPVLPY